MVVDAHEEHQILVAVIEQAFCRLECHASGDDVIKDDDVVNLCKVNVTQTDNNQWSTYKVMSGEFKVPLEAGKQIIRITIDKPYVNLDKIELKLEGTGIQSVKGDSLSDNQPLYNLHGMRVDKNYKGIIIKNGQKELNK